MSGNLENQKVILLNDSEYDGPSSHKDVLSNRQYKLKEKVNPDELLRDGLTPLNVWAYSVGHFLNDLTVVMWFMYVPYYLTHVIHIDESAAAAC